MARKKEIILNKIGSFVRGGHFNDIDIIIDAPDNFDFYQPPALSPQKI